MFQKYKSELILISFFLIFSFLLVFKVLYYKSFTPEWDESLHLLMGFRFYNAFSDNNTQWIIDLLSKSGIIYPPFYHIILAVSYSLIGISPNAGIFANIPFIFLMMFSTFKLGETIANKKVGLLAAVLVPMLPVFLTLQERTVIDYASVSTYIFSFYLLFKTEDFKNRKFSIFFGLSIALNLLVKWPFLVPSIPFCIYTLMSLRKANKNFRRVTVNILLASIMASLGLIWYNYNLYSIADSLWFFWDPKGYPQEIWRNPSGFSLNNILFYILKGPTGVFGAGLIPTVFFYIALFKKPKNSKTIYLSLSVIFLYLILTVMNDKSEYYFAYAYPPLILLTLNFLSQLASKEARNVGITIFSVAIALNFIFAQSNYFRDIKAGIITSESRIKILTNHFTKFSNYKWPTEIIARDYLDNNWCKGSLIVIPDNRYLNAPNIRYYLEIYNKNLEPSAGYDYYNPAKDVTIGPEVLEKYNCAITKSGRPGLFSNEFLMKDAENYYTLHNQYDVYDFPAPDESEIKLFIKKQSE